MKKIKLEQSSESQLASGRTQQESPVEEVQQEQEQEHELNLSSQPQEDAQSPATPTQAGQQQSQAQNNGANVQQAAANTPPNFCNICNKELCNKYFMKTHMQKMHGINLGEGGSGVMCDICQKMLCSKYFLKVHKSNTHGVTDFSSQHSAGSQAAIALANTLTNAQKCAALNLALNQHQLQQQQSRVQAAALMNATTFNPLQLSAANVAAMQQQRQQQHQQQQQQQHLQQQQQQQQQFQQQQFAQELNLSNTPVRLQQAEVRATPRANRLGSAHESDDEEASDQEHRLTPPQTLVDSQTNTLAHLEQQQQLQSRQAFLQALARNPAAAAMLAAVAHSANGTAPMLGPALAANSAEPTQALNASLANLAHTPSGPLLGANGLAAMSNFQAVMAAAAANQASQRGAQSAQQAASRNNGTNSGQNSRYLRHYTEACNICDRRFKSIKWLQSHVMNDHKNEIENLFSILVQLLICGMSGNQAGQAVNNGLASQPIATSLAANVSAANLIQNGQQQVGAIQTGPLVEASANLCNSANMAGANTNFLGNFLGAPAGLAGSLLPQAAPAAARRQQNQQPQVNPFVAGSQAASSPPQTTLQAGQPDYGPLGHPAAGLTSTLAGLIGLQQQIQSMQQQQLLAGQQPAAPTQRRRVGSQRTRRAQAACTNQAQSQRRRFSPGQLLAPVAGQNQEQQEQPLSLTTTPTSQSPNQMSSPASSAACSRGPTPASSIGSLASAPASQLASVPLVVGKLERSPSCESVSPPGTPTPHNNRHNSHHHSPIGLLFENLNRNH